MVLVAVLYVAVIIVGTYDWIVGNRKAVATEAQQAAARLNGDASGRTALLLDDGGIAAGL